MLSTLDWYDNWTQRQGELDKKKLLLILTDYHLNTKRHKCRIMKKSDGIESSILDGIITADLANPLFPMPYAVWMIKNIHVPLPGVYPGNLLSFLRTKMCNDMVLYMQNNLRTQRQLYTLHRRACKPSLIDSYNTTCS